MPGKKKTSKKVEKLDLTQMSRCELTKLAVKRKKVKKDNDHSGLTKDKLIKLLS